MTLKYALDERKYAFVIEKSTFAQNYFLCCCCVPPTTFVYFLRFLSCYSVLHKMSLADQVTLLLLNSVYIQKSVVGNGDQPYYNSKLDSRVF